MPIERAQVQGCDGNITIRHVLLKTAILHCEMAIVCSQLSTAVGIEGKFSYCFLCCVNFAQAHFYIKECFLTVTKFLITTGYPPSQTVKSEILDLSNSGNQQCPDWVDYPISVEAASGLLIGEKAIICGGHLVTQGYLPLKSFQNNAIVD